MNLSLVKTATDARTEAALAREAQWLRELESVPELDGQVPRLLEEGTGADGFRYLRISMTPARGETRLFTPDHARFLQYLGKVRFRTVEFDHSDCCKVLQQGLAEAKSVFGPVELELVRGAYRDCETALLYWTGPYVLSQGAFAPWNIRTQGGQLFVFDWGEARADASPLDDVLHYLMLQRSLSPRPITAPELREAMQCAQAFALRAYPEWPWRAPVVGALTLVYLLGNVLRARAASGPYWDLIVQRSAWLPATS
jgi:hypothetical protein